MRQYKKSVLFLLGALLMSAPGLFTAGMKWAFLAFLGVGYAVMAAGVVKNGPVKPRTALVLLVASNLSFWLSLGLAAIRMKVYGPSVLGGVDAFAGPAGVWLYLFPTYILYETVVFLWGLVVNQDRRAAGIGLVGIIAELLITVRVVYGLVQGV